MQASVIHPRIFIDDYAAPAVELFRVERGNKHLAAFAISQVDILAEVVGLWLHSQTTSAASPFNPKPFRDAVGARCQAVAVLRDAHDSHKHGRLRDQSRIISQGQRTEVVQEDVFIMDMSRMDGPGDPFDVVVLTDNAGNDHWAFSLVREAMNFWEAELKRLGA